MAKTATRQVSIFINGKEVENSIKAIAAEQKKANNELAKMIIGSEEYVDKASEIKKLNGIITEHRQGLNSIKQGYDLTRVGMDKFIGLAAGAFTVDAVLGYGKQLFNTGVQMEQLAKKAKTVFGEALPQVTAEAEKNARAMGLTNSQYINAAANIQDLLIPMGFQRKEAANISTSLLNLSGALSEWTGGTKTAAEVSTILNKALLGEREELKSLGISISEADVKAGLAAKGLDKLTGASLEQAKAATTLELIMAKSTDAQAQFADGAGTLTRRQAESAAKMQEVSEKLSRALLPVFERLIDIASGVADFFGSFASAMEAIAEPAQTASKAFDEQAKNVQSLEQNIVPLLGRYDELTSKSKLTKKEQDELRKIIDTVASAVPGAVTEFDAYGKALGLNTQAAREFIEVERARLAFVNSNAIKENTDILQKTQKQAEDQQKVIQGLQQSLKDFATTATDDTKAAISQQIGFRANELANLQNNIKGINAEISRLKGENLKTPEAQAPAASAPTAPTVKDKTASEKKIELKKQEEERLYKLEQEGQNALRQLDSIRAAESKALSDQFLSDQTTTFNDIVSRYREASQQQTLIDTEYLAGKQATEEKIQELTTSDFSAQLAATEGQYAILLELAAKYGIDTTTLKAQQALDEKEILEGIRGGAESGSLAAIQEQYDQQLLQLQQFFSKKLAAAKGNATETLAIQQQLQAELLALDTDANLKRLDVYAAAFSGIANSLTEAFSLFSDSQSKFASFQKGIALFQIAIDTARAISSIVAAASSTSLTPIDLALKIAAGSAIVFANIAKAKKLLEAPVPVKQKFTGGYTEVTGATDGRTYNPQVIGTPNTGLLPNHPVLFRSNADGAPVLASERGAEYFVASKDLRNPAVANYVRLIDDIVTTSGARVRQFAEGGVNQGAPAATTVAATDSPLMREMAALMAQQNQLLSYLISNGVTAIVPDGTVIGINDRLKKLQKISGDYF